jgi:long-chain acyl-CoA synthetase
VQCSSREEFVAHAQVRACYEGIVAELNENLAKFEKLKKFELLAEEFSPANGTMTASMKIRRRAVEEHCRGLIDAMYAEEVESV